MRSLWKKKEETHQVLYPEGRREERRKGGARVGLTSPPLRGSGEGCSRPPLPLLPASLLAQTHSEPGKQKHRSHPDFHQPGDELLLTLKRERSRKSLCAVVFVGSSRDDWSSSFQSRSCPRICSSGAAFSATPTHTQHKQLVTLAS